MPEQKYQVRMQSTYNFSRALGHFPESLKNTKSININKPISNKEESGVCTLVNPSHAFVIRNKIK